MIITAACVKLLRAMCYKMVEGLLFKVCSNCQEVTSKQVYNSIQRILSRFQYVFSYSRNSQHFITYVRLLQPTRLLASDPYVSLDKFDLISHNVVGGGNASEQLMEYNGYNGVQWQHKKTYKMERIKTNDISFFTLGILCLVKVQ